MQMKKTTANGNGNGHAHGHVTNRIKEAARELVIAPVNMEVVKLLLVGTAPLVQHAFPNKAREMIIATQEAGSVAKKGKKRESKDFAEGYNQARHIATAGWDGISANGFRRAMVDACKLAGFVMTDAKKSLFVVADGHDEQGTSLVKITKGKPHMTIMPVRNANGSIDMRARPMWDAGWECVLTVQYDADRFCATDVVNLVSRVGIQCGICEGRPNSKSSTGCGWGLFSVKTNE